MPPVDNADDNPRARQLHAELDNDIAIAQATGMISQRTGKAPGESAVLLAEYATAQHDIVVAAARRLIEQHLDIETVLAVRVVS